MSTSEIRPFASSHRIEPMLAATDEFPLDSSNYLYEIKWEGLRAIAVIEGGHVSLHTRKTIDLSSRFRKIMEALVDGVQEDRVVLDGELVAVDDDGVPRRHLVMDHWQRQDDARLARVSFEVFDILYRGGESLLDEPLHLRKHHLSDCLSPNRLVHECHYQDTDGAALYGAARDLGLDGIIAKGRTSRYRPGTRSRDWLKVNQSRKANLVIGGYTVGGIRRQELFGSLLLGAYHRGKLKYVGSVSGRFEPPALASIYSVISTLHIKESPFWDPPRVQRLLYWCQPELAIEVNYGEISRKRQLQFPVFNTLRPDLSPADCTVSLMTDGNRGDIQ